MKEGFQIFAIGMVKKRGKRVTIEIDPEYIDGLMGLDQNSHIIVFSWFHRSDTPAKRKTLQVHPRGDKTNPLTGVFATRSPVRPNPMSISATRILSIDGTVIHVEDVDAFDGTPVIDIKPYVPRLDAVSEVSVPEWAKKRPHD